MARMGDLAGQPVPEPATTVHVTLDAAVVKAFVEWCGATGEHHGRDWEPMLEQLRNAPRTESAPQHPTAGSIRPITGSSWPTL